MTNDNHEIENRNALNGVAIIGMAASLPKAKNVDEFWQNLVNGVECITFYTDEELIESGIDPEVVKNPYYVKAKGEVANVDIFDADFFGINPREAELTDPQHRMLLECAWEALEHAGYDSSKYDGRIGVFAGESMDYYLLLNVYPQIKKEISAGSLLAAVGNDKDSLTTTISYRLNLTGPAITIQTSSSTSLVAVSVACQSLLTYQCDIALAGGITAGPPIKSGYKYQEGGIWSPDGHCRAFDAGAKGFVPAAGMGLAVLKRMEDAFADGDTVWAVIKGYAVNNDGSKKVSYHAPSVDAQAEVVAEALAVADWHPETVQYIETHGTGTYLGDPIEITALTQAFRTYTDKTKYCALGSLKTNIGHLDNAAGIAGLIKVALSLYHKKMTPTLHFKAPNPRIDFENSPFFVNTELREWQTNDAGTPRRAGVTSLGMGGTNAHVVLEEAPVTAAERAVRETSDRSHQLLLLSARTPTALEKVGRNLAEHIKNNPGIDLADAAYTLAVGRRDMEQRRFVLGKDNEEAIGHLQDLTPGRVFDAECRRVDRPVVFMFSGQGAQYVDMGRELYLHEPVFKENIDRCATILLPLLGLDLRGLLYPGLYDVALARGGHESGGSGETYLPDLNQTWLTQPALFMIEYSLAQLWMEWGITPAGMIGHSIGEFVAACISGCLSLEDALKVVATRGRLMQAQDTGAMLSVEVGETEIDALLAKDFPDLSLAAVNSPNHCVVSGKIEAVAGLEKALKDRNIYCRQLHTSHAFHSPMMEPARQAFAEVMAGVQLNAPKIPFISCVTGKWISAQEARSPHYWADQLRKPVRFSDGIREITNDPARLLLELGPGNSLCLLVKRFKNNGGEESALSSLRHVKQTDPDTVFLLKTLGNLWLLGVCIRWQNYYKGELRHRIPLPAYPFERKRYWLESPKETDRYMTEKVMEKEKTELPDAKVPGPDQEKNKSERTFQKRPALNNEYIAPANDTERTIVEIWEDILSIRPIGVEDNFFDLGGHSLLATLFLSRLQEIFNIRLELRSIFETSTIAAIAAQLEAEKSKKLEVVSIEEILQEIEKS